MLIIFIILGIVLMLIGYFLSVNSDLDGFDCFLVVVGAIIFVVAIFVTVFTAVDVSQLRTIDAKIEMYQEENEKIETQIAECVENYMKFESQIFTEVAPKDAIAIVTAYPELRSDDLVAMQIDTYLANNKEIKRLKETKIDADVLTWWLYFGRYNKD